MAIEISTIYSLIDTELHDNCNKIGDLVYDDFLKEYGVKFTDNKSYSVTKLNIIIKLITKLNCRLLEEDE